MKGYLLGFVIFIAGIPTLMWWAAGMPQIADISLIRMLCASALCLAGLALSVWSIIYMKRVATAIRSTRWGTRSIRAPSIS